jgi:mono/diheme cytochrome c family protein
MTGMPAFGPTEDEEEIWHMVAFVRHLPELTDDEMARLRERARYPTPAPPPTGPTPAAP